VILSEPNYLKAPCLYILVVLPIVGLGKAKHLKFCVKIDSGGYLHMRDELLQCVQGHMTRFVVLGTCTLYLSSAVLVTRYGSRKVSNHNSDLQDHSRALAMVPFDRPHNFLLVFHCNLLSLFCTIDEIRVLTLVPKI